MIDIDMILKELVKRRGSDLHMKVDRPPLMRISGQLLPTEYPVVSKEDMEGVLRVLLKDAGYEKLVHDFEADTSYTVEGIARFRVNSFKQMDKFGIVMRTIPLKPPTIDQMGHPPVLKDILAAPQGMILVTGPTGSGKSTSLAAMINHLNETEPLHIVTIEDPVEFIYSDNKCTINQRQLGNDVKTLGEALRRVLRQDPDVILMGEMRDAETIELAMHAAETGHLVFSTLHTNDAKQTLDRIVDTFPADAAHQIRAMLSLTLHSVISQRLVRRADGNGRVAAMEIMINSPNIRELIAAGKIASIDKEIGKSGDYYRMQTFNQALAKLVASNTITEEEAMATSTAPGDLRLLIKGIAGGQSALDTAIRDTEKRNAEAAAGKTGSQPAVKPAAGGAPATESSGKIKITRGF